MLKINWTWIKNLFNRPDLKRQSKRRAELRRQYEQYHAERTESERKMLLMSDDPCSDDYDERCGEVWQEVKFD